MKTVIAAIITVSVLLAPLTQDYEKTNNERSVQIQILGELPEVRETVTLAVKRFASAGLELPPLTIHLHISMDERKGGRGLYARNGDGRRVDICTRSERIIIHELAHAWEQHQVDDDLRNRLLIEWDLEFWQNLDVPHHERGIEVAANIVEVGLMFNPPQRSRGRPATGDSRPFRDVDRCAVSSSAGPVTVTASAASISEVGSSGGSGSGSRGRHRRPGLG